MLVFARSDRGLSLDPDEWSDHPDARSFVPALIRTTCAEARSALAEARAMPCTGVPAMDDATREKLLKFALVAFGAVFFLIYPLGLVWPSGWLWHGGHGQYYLQMICGIYVVLGAFLIMAARHPAEHRSLISFTVWSSVAHAGIMGAQALYDGQEAGHLAGDVPALLLVAAVLWYLSPARHGQTVTA
jgi:hypothetical protein